MGWCGILRGGASLTMPRPTGETLQAFISISLQPIQLEIDEVSPRRFNILNLDYSVWSSQICLYQHSSKNQKSPSSGDVKSCTPISGGLVGIKYEGWWVTMYLNGFVSPHKVNVNAQLRRFRGRHHLNSMHPFSLLHVVLLNKVILLTISITVQFVAPSKFTKAWLINIAKLQQTFL